MSIFLRTIFVLDNIVNLKSTDKSTEPNLLKTREIFCFQGIIGTRKNILTLIHLYSNTQTLAIYRKHEYFETLCA